MAPEIKGGRAQAYGRTTNGTVKPKEQRATSKAKPNPPAARPRRQSQAAPPPSSSRGVTRREKVGRKPVVETASGSDEEGSRNDSHSLDSIDEDGRGDTAVGGEDELEDEDVEFHGPEFDVENGDDVAGFGDHYYED